MDLLNGNGIQPTFDDAEDAAEAPGGVDQIQTAETLRVVVLRDGGGLLDVGVDGGDFGDANSFHVHDRAAGLEEVTGFARAGGQTGIGHLLVFDGEIVKHAFGGGDFVHGSQVDFAHLLNVYGSTILSIY